MFDFHIDAHRTDYYGSQANGCSHPLSEHSANLHWSHFSITSLNYGSSITLVGGAMSLDQISCLLRSSSGNLALFTLPTALTGFSRSGGTMGAPIAIIK